MLNQCLEKVELKIFPPSSPAPATRAAAPELQRASTGAHRPARGAAPASSRRRCSRSRHDEDARGEAAARRAVRITGVSDPRRGGSE